MTNEPLTTNPKSAPSNRRPALHLGTSGRHALVVLTLVAAWCALWADISIANIISGLIVAEIASRMLGNTSGGSVRFGPLVRFVVVVMWDLVVSTVDVARETLSPGRATDEAIIAVRIPPQARHHLLLLIVAITVTPGSAVVSVDPDDGVLYLHLLNRSGCDTVVEHVTRLARLSCDALPVPTNQGVKS